MSHVPDPCSNDDEPPTDAPAVDAVGARRSHESPDGATLGGATPPNSAVAPPHVAHGGAPPAFASAASDSTLRLDAAAPPPGDASAVVYARDSMRTVHSNDAAANDAAPVPQRPPAASLARLSFGAVLGQAALIERYFFAGDRGATVVACDYVKAARHGQPATICGVPIDLREATNRVFERFENRAVARAPAGSRVVPLVNSGFRGTGKSVLLLFDCARFVTSALIKAEHDDLQPLAISVTFNGSQGGVMPKRATDEWEFAEAICNRIVDQLLKEAADINREPAGTTLRADVKSALAGTLALDVYDASDRSQAMREAARERAKAAIASRDGSKLIERVLLDVKAALGVDAETPVLLAVDELSLSVDEKTTANASTLRGDFLSLLNRGVDKIHDDAVTRGKRRGWLYLSVSVYNCWDVVDFTTASSRPVLLQPLPPVLPFPLSRLHLASTAPVLRPFVDPVQRALLPFVDKAAVAAYACLSSWLIGTGGHPRTVANLLDNLATASGNAPWVQVKDRATASAFAEQLVHRVEGLRVNSESDLLSSFVNWQTCFDTAFSRLDFAAMMGELARDCVVPFRFPQDTADGHQHAALLSATQTAAASFLLPGIGDQSQGRAFVPLPALLAPTNLAGKVAGNARAAALVALGKAINGYFTSGYDHTNDDELGKPFESAIARAMHLVFAAGTDTTTLGRMCRVTGGGGGGVFTKRLRTGECKFFELPSEFESGAKLRFPFKHTPLPQELLQLETLLGSEWLLQTAICVPLFKFNELGDFIGVFPVEGTDETVLVFFQCKDSFKASATKDGIRKFVFDEFRKGRCLVESGDDAPPPAFATWLSNQQQKQGREVHVAIVLVSANPLATEQAPGGIGWRVTEFAPDGTLQTALPEAQRQTALPAAERTLFPNEGLIDIPHMKNWLPTAGYNLESAHKMSALWRDVASASST
jgi:hypothetical protein